MTLRATWMATRPTSSRLKVGFFTLKYSMTAHRHISGSGGDDPQQQGLSAKASPRAAPMLEGNPVFVIDTDAPVKSRAWKKYRRHIALELIDDY